jgi:hypothetical protein
MIKSEVFRGLIYPGSTPLYWSGSFEQIAPNKLRLHEGVFVSTEGTNYLVEYQDFTLPDGLWRIELMPDGDVLVNPVTYPPSSPLIILAGYDLGIRVEDDQILGDIWELRVPSDSPSPVLQE